MTAINSVSLGAVCPSLPSGESEPSVMLAFAPGGNISNRERRLPFINHGESNEKSIIDSSGEYMPERGGLCG